MREGMVPALLGTAVTAAGAALWMRNRTAASGVLGFGLAHVLLGAIDLMEHRRTGFKNRVRPVLNFLMRR